MRVLGLIVFLSFMGCSESGEKGWGWKGLRPSGSKGFQKEKSPESENRRTMKGGESSVIAPIKRAKDIKSLEERRQSELKKEYESLREEGL